MHAYIHACMHTYIYTYIHTYMHTYMHACMYTAKGIDGELYLYAYRVCMNDCLCLGMCIFRNFNSESNCEEGKSPSLVAVNYLGVCNPTNTTGEVYTSCNGTAFTVRTYSDRSCMHLSHTNSSSPFNCLGDGEGSYFSQTCAAHAPSVPSSSGLPGSFSNLTAGASSGAGVDAGAGAGAGAKALLKSLSLDRGSNAVWGRVGVPAVTPGASPPRIEQGVAERVDSRGGSLQSASVAPHVSSSLLSGYFVVVHYEASDTTCSRQAAFLGGSNIYSILPNIAFAANFAYRF
jgi:hypothetical protein